MIPSRPLDPTNAEIIPNTYPNHTQNIPNRSPIHPKIKNGGPARVVGVSARFNQTEPQGRKGQKFTHQIKPTFCCKFQSWSPWPQPLLLGTYANFKVGHRGRTPSSSSLSSSLSSSSLSLLCTVFTAESCPLLILRCCGCCHLNRM
jgi:hypothetical protein